MRRGAVTKKRHFERYSGLTPTQVAGLRRSNRLATIERLQKLDDGFVPYLLGPLATGQEYEARSFMAYRFAAGRVFNAVKFARLHPDRFTLQSTEDAGGGLRSHTIRNHAYMYRIFEQPGTPYRCLVEREDFN